MTRFSWRLGLLEMGPVPHLSGFQGFRRAWLAEVGEGAHVFVSDVVSVSLSLSLSLCWRARSCGCLEPIVL